MFSPGSRQGSGHFTAWKQHNKNRRVLPAIGVQQEPPTHDVPGTQCLCPSAEPCCTEPWHTGVTAQHSLYGTQDTPSCGGEVLLAPGKEQEQAAAMGFIKPARRLLLKPGKKLAAKELQAREPLQGCTMMASCTLFCSTAGITLTGDLTGNFSTKCSPATKGTSCKLFPQQTQETPEQGRSSSLCSQTVPKHEKSQIIHTPKAFDSYQ